MLKNSKQLPNGNRAQLVKLLSLGAAILLIAILLIIARTGRASGYEISIYAAYPWYFWVLLIALFGLGILILVREAFAGQKSSWWVAGLAIIIAANSVLLLLPLFRGYFAHGFYDPLARLGQIRDILLSGHFSLPGTAGENFYPATHILASSISFITGIHIESVVEVVPPIFMGFYVISVYVLSRQLTQSHFQALLISAFASLPLITSTQEPLTTFVPRILTVLVLPFILYLYYKRAAAIQGKAQYLALFMLVLVAAVFFHPLDGALFLVVVFLCLDIAVRISTRLGSKANSTSIAAVTLPSNSVRNACLLLLVVWFIWDSSSYMFYLQVNSLTGWFGYGISNPELQQFVFYVERASVPFYDTVTLFLKRYGYHLLYAVSALTISLLYWGKLIFTRRRSDQSLAPFSLLFIVWGGLLLLSMVTGYSLGHTRFISYIIFASAFVNGIGVYQLSRRVHIRTLVPVVTVFLIVVSGLSIFDAYWSPYTAGENQQVTKSDMQGLSWFLDERNEGLRTDEMTFTQYNHTSALLGRKLLPKNIQEHAVVEAYFPEHFGYREYSSYGAAIDKDRYFLSHKLDRIYYSQRIPEYKEAWRWTPDDFEQLENDNSVSRIYDSGEFEVYYVKSMAD